MTTKTDSKTFTSGLTLRRFAESDAPGSIDDQCATIPQWYAWLDRLAHDSHEYYNQANGFNKFFESFEINDYSRFCVFPNNETALALTYALGNDRSRIDIQYFDPNVSAYRFPAALSHEVGHAYAHWCGFYVGRARGAGLEEVAYMWERMINSAGTAMGDGSKAPWTSDPGWEQFANTFRVFFGTDQAPGNTRGSSPPSSSPPGTIDAIKPGFENPADHPDWKRMIQFLPELCGFIRSYGCAPGLVWRGWYFYLQTTIAHAGIPAGTWVYMDWYYTIAGRLDGFHYWDGHANGNQGAWIRWAPQYVRS